MAGVAPAKPLNTGLPMVNDVVLTPVVVVDPLPNATEFATDALAPEPNATPLVAAAPTSAPSPSAIDPALPAVVVLPIETEP
ncbi:hypothetical protein BvRS1_54380 [Burkholderia vietnamiensis]|nr:hypothetical protein BvRS1_54380 [Burkholderia vietnamiensis]